MSYNVIPVLVALEAELPYELPAPYVRTCLDGSLDSRFASTQPAVPAPTII